MQKNLRIAISLLLALVFNISFGQIPNWTNLGPIPFPIKTIGQVHGIGRCSQIKFHPSDPNKMYAASASGGLWYSADKGVNWKSLGTDMVTSTSSASVAIDPTNDQVIYWGTGDADYYYDGLGVYKTTNGGATWTQSNTGMGNKLVKEMIILPTDSQTILAGTSAGVYKTTNGGSTWTLKSSAVAIQDIVFKPGTNGQIVYACSQNGFYRSLDAGNTWTQITSPSFVFGGGGAKLEVCPASPNVVYIGNSGTSSIGEIYKSTDGGSTFVSTRSETTNHLAGYDANSSGQGGYNFDIGLNPADPNELYLCAHLIWRSTDGGSTWTQQQPYWAGFLHTDQHHILFDPYVSGQLWNSNDGGVWSNTTNGTGDWTPMSDGIAATEIYHSANSKTNKQVMYIGTQDNGGFYYNVDKFYNDRGGDYGPHMWFDYSSNYYEESDGNRRPYPSGSSVSLNLPATPSAGKFAFTPANTNIAYHANAGKIYRCTNLTSSTPSWTQIYAVPSGNIKDLQVDAGNADRLYVFTDTPGLYRSDNATTTANFVQLTLPSTSTGASIAPIPNSNVVYLSQGSSIYRSADKGASWTATTGFPAATVTKVVADPKSSIEAVYACYNLGVYYKDNAKPSWVNYSAGLPLICGITDMDFYNDGISQGLLNISYYGRGIWQSKLVPAPTNITLALTSPANNASFAAPATINLAATASASSGSISKVEFYNGTTLLGTSTSSPFTFSWGSVLSGNYSITAVAYDNLGNKASSASINITVNIVCNQITGTPFGTAPYAAGSEYDKAFDGNTNTAFDASSSDSGYAGLDLGTAKVVTGIRYYPRSGWSSRMPGGKFQGSNTSTSTGFVDLYTIQTEPNYVWQEVSIPNSTAYRYYRYLSPVGGNCNVAEIQFCGINNQLPTVSITAPADNALYPSVPATVNLTANASDTDGTISKVEFYQGTTLLGTDTSSPYSYSWTGVATGTYQLTAKAYDNLGATSSSTVVTTIVGNQNPSVSIVSPDNYASFPNPASITIYATAADPDGTITKVEFYNGATLLGTSTTSPYSYTWTGVPIGTYSLTAKAYDNNGGIRISSAITANVIFSCTQVSGTPFGTSPAYAPGSEYDKAFDGNTDTFFDDTHDTGGYTGSDLGTAKIIKALRFYPRGSYEDRMNGGKFQASNVADFSSGTVDLYTLASAPNSGWNEITISNGTAFRYVRYLGPNSGYTNVAEIQFCGLDNASPTVNITSPSNNATYAAPTTVNIAATASDADGTISKVEFYIGVSLLATSTTSPYSYSLTNLGVGTYNLIAKAYDNSGAMTTASPITFTVVNPTAPTITFNGNSKVYGDPAFPMTASSNSAGTLTYSITAGGSFASINASTGQLTITGVGTVTVKADQVANGTYSAGSATATLTIAKKALTATADDKNKAFNTANPTLTVTYSGFAYSDNAANLTTQATATTTAVTTSPAGTYPITPTGAASNNYTFTYVNGTLTVNPPVTPTITFNGNSKAYGDPAFPMTASSNSAGALTYSITAGGSFASINANTGQLTIIGTGTVTVKVDQAADGSYSAGSATATLTIAKKALTVTADNKSKAYNTANPALTVTYSGFAYTDTPSNLTSQAIATTTAVTNSPAGTYPITPAAAASNNYTFTYVNGTLTVNPPSVPTITFNGNSKVYGDTAFSMTATSNSTGTLTYSITAGGSFASIDPSTGQLTITGAGSVTVKVDQAANGSYSAGSATATLTIAKKTLTVTADDKSKAYNTANPALTVTYSGFAYSDNVASLTSQATASTTAVTTSPAGTYTIIPSGATSNNYTFTYVNGTLTVNPAVAPTIIFNDNTKIYGDTAFPMTASSNSAGALTYSITAGGSFASINASTGQLIITGSGTVTVKVDQAADGSYSTGSAMATLTIAKKVLTVTADDKSKAYNTANPALTVTYTSFAYADNPSNLTPQATATTTAVTNSPAGTYPITPAGAASNNYTFNYVNGILTVNPSTNIAPNVSITSPANNATFTSPATISISANASDPDGTISKVEFYDGATLLGTSASTPYGFNWAGAATGNHSITAKATDNSGAVSSSTPVKVVVKNKPIVNMTSPSGNNLLVDQGTDITFAFTVTDPDAALMNITIYDNGVMIGTMTQAPYTLNVTNLSPPDHHFSVSVTLQDGTSYTITTVDVVVKNCSSAAWANPTNYQVGDQVNFQNTIYRALADNTNKQPDLNTSVWSNIGTCSSLGFNDTKMTRQHSIYPNPCETQFNIKLTDYKGLNLHYQIMDMNSKLLAEKNMGVIDNETYECKVHTQGYPSGTYLVYLYLDNKVIIEKIIVVEKPSIIKKREHS